MVNIHHEVFSHDLFEETEKLSTVIMVPCGEEQDNTPGIDAGIV